MNTRQAQLIGTIIAILSANFFSSKVLFVKLAYAEGATPLQILGIRMATALPFFAIVGWYLIRKYPQKRPRAKDLLGMSMLGFLGYYLSSLLDFHGIQYISSGLERLLLYLYPSMLIIIRCVARQAWPDRKEVFSLILAYIGAAVFYMDEYSSIGTDAILGGAMVLAAALCYAIYLFYSTRYIDRYGSRIFASFSTTVSCLAIVLHAGISNGGQQFEVSTLAIIIGVNMGIFCTVIPTFALHKAIEMIGAAKVGILGTSGLLCPFILGILLFDEPLTILRIIGSLLVIVSVVAINRSGKENQQIADSKGF